MTEKRFTYGNSDKGIALTDELKCEHYYWLSSEDCKDIVDLLNSLSEENEQLKQQKDRWKQQCIHFKEMLDDMDIAYLCDEWIYEELKGDVE